MLEDKNMKEDTNKTQQIDDMHKRLDKFIQNALNKFKFVEVTSDIYTKAGNDKNSIISHKSTIPDLVIWNKPFNKNECFAKMKDSNKYNKYPRIPFYLRLNNKKINNASEPKIKEEFIPIESLADFVDRLNLNNGDMNKENTIKKIEPKLPNKKPNTRYINKQRTNYITPINESKKKMNNYYQTQFDQNELLLNYVYSFLDKKGWYIFGNNGSYLSNFTSFELFTFLTNSLKNNADLKMYVIGMQNNSSIFNGEQIYIILSQTLPFILQKKQKEFELKQKKKTLIKLNKEEKENICNNYSIMNNSNNSGNGQNKFGINKFHCNKENNENMLNSIKFNV